jgi:hypothetical protein
MRELLFGRLGHGQKVMTRLGRGIAAGMTLEELGPQALFQRVDVADHRGVVHPQDLGGTGHRPEPRHLKSRADFVPVFHGALDPVRLRTSA